MKTLLLAAAAATFVISAAPTFANYADFVHQGIGVEYPGYNCHFVREPVRMPNGRAAYRVVEVCNGGPATGIVTIDLGVLPPPKPAR